MRKWSESRFKPSGKKLAGLWWVMDRKTNTQVGVGYVTREAARKEAMKRNGQVVPVGVVRQEGVVVAHVLPASRPRRFSALPVKRAIIRASATKLRSKRPTSIVRAVPVVASTDIEARMDAMVSRLLDDLRKLISTELRKRGTAQIQEISRRLLIA